MAIVFDPARAKVDEAYRTEALKLYEKGDLKISDNDLKWLKEVTGTYTDNLNYEIDDIEVSSSKYEISDKNETKQEEANKETLTRDNSSSKTHAIVDLTASAGAAVASTAVGLSAASGLSGWQAQMAGCNSMATEIACLTAFAVGTKYTIMQPNKSEHEELMKLKDAMEAGDVEMANAALGVADSQENIEELSEKTEGVKNDLDKELETKQKELEEKMARINELEEKSKTEEGLTEAEKSELESLTGEIDIIKNDIEKLKADGVGEIEEDSEDIEAEEDNIEDSKNIFETMDDVAKYAESNDETTKSAATIEAVAQGANAAMGYGAAAALTFHSPMLYLTGYGQIMRALALSGAAMSTVGVVQQTGYASDIGDEIQVRENLQSDVETSAELAEETTENITAATDNAKELVDDIENIKPEENLPENVDTVNINTIQTTESKEQSEDDKIKKPEEIN